GGVRLPAALLGPRPVVAAADRAHDARAAAADQRRDDRAAIPSQGCRRAALGRLGHFAMRLTHTPFVPAKAGIQSREVDAGNSRSPLARGRTETDAISLKFAFVS